jgi:hypothetical protein
MYDHSLSGANSAMTNSGTGQTHCTTYGIRQPGTLQLEQRARKTNDTDSTLRQSGLNHGRLQTLS